MALEVTGISKRFGGLQALDGVSFVAPAGHVTAIIGPNGAGKSTLLDCLSGITPMDAGSVALEGRRLSAAVLDDLIGVGITRTFQTVRFFESLTMVEHVLLARRGYRQSARFRAASDRRGDRDVCRELLARVGLAEKGTMYPHALAYGEKRRLEIARGLATEPRVFLLDEPAAGSTPAERAALAGLIGEMAGRGITVILVEHHMELVGRLAASVVVLNFGKMVVTGTMAEVRRHPEVIAAYLGTARNWQRGG
jgi:branched-chain amino acid transport system ATP-binding protein/branched-chain amino acid transport system permease protein